jgi:hypothetical protein
MEKVGNLLRHKISSYPLHDEVSGRFRDPPDGGRCFCIDNMACLIHLHPVEKFVRSRPDILDRSERNGPQNGFFMLERPDLTESKLGKSLRAW